EAEADPAVLAGLQAEEAPRVAGATDDDRAVLRAREAGERRTHLLAGREREPDGQRAVRQGGIRGERRVGELALHHHLLRDREGSPRAPRRHIADLERGAALADRLLQVAESVAVVVDAVVADLLGLLALWIVTVDEAVAVVVDAVVADLHGAGVDRRIVVVAVRRHALVVAPLGEPVAVLVDARAVHGAVAVVVDAVAADLRRSRVGGGVAVVAVDRPTGAALGPDPVAVRVHADGVGNVRSGRPEEHVDRPAFRVGEREAVVVRAAHDEVPDPVAVHVADGERRAGVVTRPVAL